MTTLIEKLINKEPILDSDIEDELYEICCNVHSSCSSECPIYQNIFNEKDFEKMGNCPCHKNGKLMLDLLRHPEKKEQIIKEFNLKKINEEIIKKEKELQKIISDNNSVLLKLEEKKRQIEELKNKSQEVNKNE